ncbi:MAG TPA: SGNH/GDSL hydrolase family protein [Kiritimatiellia bacterium]|nr:SGNH/GDSL hydrolase family protein [Kiritimatiellia bacterium]
MARSMLVGIDLLLAGSLLLVPLLWLFSSLRVEALGLALAWKKAWFFLPLAPLFLRVALKAAVTRWIAFPPRGLAESGWYKKLTLLVAGPFVFFVALEQAFQVVGYEAHLPPVVVRGDDATPGEDPSESTGLIHCDELRYRFVPGVVWRGRKVNQLGFLDREVNPVKSDGSIRVICMGDSITAQGSPPYSWRLHDLLQANPPTDDPWEAFNMAVHGYSSVIGLRLFELRGAALHPDIVTLYYGWNDHWLGGRMPDRARMAVRMSPARAKVYEVLRNKRFGQWLLSRVPSERPMAWSRAEGYLRVPPEDYVETLTAFIAAIRAAGAVPVLITAPRTERPHDMLVKRGNAVSVEEIIRLHDAYIDLTRQVARDQGAHLLDLAKIFMGLDRDALMQADGIHMTNDGLDAVARYLHQKITEITRHPDWRTATAL